MKKSFKQCVCKTITSFACATFMFVGIMGISSTSVNAATGNYSVDLSGNKTITMDYSEFTSAKMKAGKSDTLTLSKSFKDGFMIATTLYLYGSNPDMPNSTSVLSKSPYQAITNSTSTGNITFKAAANSIGTGNYVISKSAFVDKKIKDTRPLESMRPFLEAEAVEFIKECEAVIYGKEGNGDSTFVVNIKYSSLPLLISNKINGAAASSFITGSEFEANGIRYRVNNSNGNLSALSITRKAKKIIVPDSVVYSGYTMNVTDIGQAFLKGNKKVQNVVIGKNVTTIGNKAFWNCKKLRKVKINSEKVTSFGKKAFGRASKDFYVKIPKSCNKYHKLFNKAGLKAIKVK